MPATVDPIKVLSGTDQEPPPKKKEEVILFLGGKGVGEIVVCSINCTPGVLLVCTTTIVKGNHVRWYRMLTQTNREYGYC